MKKMIGMAALAVSMMLGGAEAALAQFGAFATGTINTNAVGIAAGMDSPAAARRLALQVCRNRGGIGCRVQYRWSGPGCVWVTNGSNVYGQLGWGSGPTPIAALTMCQARGLVCNVPISGCNQW